MKNIFIALFLMSGLFAFGQSGTLDPDFDGDGKVISNFSAGEEYANKVVQLPNGKILVGGTQLVGSDNDFVLTCYNPDGSLDLSFNGSGTSTGDINLAMDEMNSFAVQADGKIVCVGHTGSLNMDSYNIAIMRFNATGGLDGSFGTNGIIVIDINSNTDEATDVAIQPDGKIVVVGYGNFGLSNNSYESMVFRFNTDGTADNTFSFDGRVSTTVSADVDLFRKVLLQPDGKIVGIGFAFTSNLNGCLVRYNNDGTLDNSFGNSGKVITDYTNGDVERLYGGSLQPDGKIIVCGQAHVGSDDDFLVARYKANGTLDSAFATNGIRTIDISLTDDYSLASTLQSDGKIILGGVHANSTDYDATCFRINTDGSLDYTFSGGFAYLATDVITGNSDGISSLAMQTDGKILACGSSSASGSSDYSKFVLRILSGLTIGVAEFSVSETAPLLYPNPIQQVETLKYTLAENETISISLIDATGKLVQTFIENEKQAKGDQEQVLNFPTNLAKGNYYLIISSPKGKTSIKLLN